MKSKVKSILRTFIRLRSSLVLVTIFQCCYHCCVRGMKMLLKVDKDRGNDPVCGTMHKKRTPCHHKHLSSPYLCNIYFKSIFIAVFLCLLFLLLLWGSTTSKINNPFIRPRRWSIFRVMRCRWFIFQQRCGTDYFWEKLNIAIVVIIFLDHRERLFFDYFAHFRTDYFAIIH